jgi:UDPglucose 6-dehydrogenase
MRFVDGVVDDLLAHIRRPALIVGKSTVPVGTARRLSHLIEETPTASGRVTLAWNPEFLREGFAVEDTLAPDRLVFGVADATAEATLREIYAPLLERDTPLFVTGLETAELVKVAANSFLATKISFINSMAEVCEAVGGDVVMLADAIGVDTRIGRRFLNAGVGFGGGCLGKDIRAFRARGQELGVGHALEFLGTVDAVNNRRRARVVELAREVLGGNLAGRRIAILGAAFKPNSDDVRDSPALHVAKALHREGALVRVHDPAAIENAQAAAPMLDFGQSIDDAVEDAELVIHLTEWSEYRYLDPRFLATAVTNKVIIDARNALDGDKWSSAGWTFHSLGRPVARAWSTGHESEAEPTYEETKEAVA